jgi:coenzyme F420-0:L-glutamate ligase/coenzyme F420-1:gamma-L-glutamate ligase
VLIQINQRYACHAAGIQIVSHRRRPTPGRTPERLELIGVNGIPLIKEGDDIAQVLWDAFLANSLHATDDDILVVSHKIVSKAEGCMVRLDDIAPSDAARQLARETEKDPRIVQLILNESKEIVRKKPGVIIVEHRLGFVMANAGVDQSNVPAGYALLLPRDPDQSAEDLRQGWQSRCQKRLAVVIADSVGRAWRNGVIGHAVGVAGMEPLEDLRGRQDMLGRPLRHTQTAIADSIAGAAALIMGETSEAIPFVLVRGFHRNDDSKGIRTLLRDRSEDLFR